MQKFAEFLLFFFFFVIMGTYGSTQQIHFQKSMHTPRGSTPKLFKEFHFKLCLTVSGAQEIEICPSFVCAAIISKPNVPISFQILVVIFFYYFLRIFFVFERKFQNATPTNRCNFQLLLNFLPTGHQKTRLGFLKF